MDPVTMMALGMAFSSGTSMLGGFMNSSAQQQANDANLREAQWQATGGYLPGLIANAKAAGINPLAVLPGGGGSANISPVTGVGTAMGDIGQNISRALSVMTPHDERMQSLQEKQLQASIDRDRAMAASTTASAVQQINAAGNPPAPRHLAWPLDIPADISAAVKSDQGFDLNDLAKRSHDWALTANRWMLDHPFFGQDPGAGAWTN